MKSGRSATLSSIFIVVDIYVIGIDSEREMINFVFWLISIGMGLKYFTLYAIPVKGVQTLPPCILRFKMFSIQIALDMSWLDKVTLY